VPLSNFFGWVVAGIWLVLLSSLWFKFSGLMLNKSFQSKFNSVLLESSENYLFFWLTAALIIALRSADPAWFFPLGAGVLLILINRKIGKN
jgi:uncharacterized membrane protein